MPDVWVFLHQVMLQYSADTNCVSYSSVQSDTIHLIPQVKGSVSWCCPHFRCQLHLPGCHLLFGLADYKSAFPQSPPQVWYFARTAHRTQGNVFTGLSYNKDIDEQLDEDIRKAQKGSKCRRFCPHGFGLYHPPSTWVCSPVWQLSKAHSSGIFMEASLYRHDQLLT